LAKIEISGGRRVAGQGHRTLDGILQFADIARKIIGQQAFGPLGTEPGRGLPIRAAKAARNRAKDRSVAKVWKFSSTDGNAAVRSSLQAGESAKDRPQQPHRRTSMKPGTRWQTIVCSLFVVLLPLKALAHGDVTPHPLDTTGLAPVAPGADYVNPYRGNAKAIAIGSDGYLHNCAGCHGLNAVSGGVAPDLLAVAKDCFGMKAKDQQEACLKDTDEYFRSITLHGKKTGEGRYTMPGYSSVFTEEAVWAIKSYLDARTVEMNR
jgi:cytochrome c-550 PedF